MSPCRLPTFRSGTPWAVLSFIALVSPAAAAESKTLNVVVKGDGLRLPGRDESAPKR